MNLKTGKLLLGFVLCLFTPIVVFSGTIQYTYDNAGRLAGVAYEDGMAIYYIYDKNGNLLERKTSASPTTPTVYVSAGDCGGLTPCYHTIKDAVSGAANEALIKVGAEVFASDTTVDAGKTLTIEWGYNADFTSNTGVTEIQGTFTARDKTIIRSGILRGK